MLTFQQKVTIVSLEAGWDFGLYNYQKTPTADGLCFISTGTWSKELKKCQETEAGTMNTWLSLITVSVELGSYVRSHNQPLKDEDTTLMNHFHINMLPSPPIFRPVNETNKEEKVQFY